MAAIGGCHSVPSDPVQLPLGLRRTGDTYSILLGGDCTYPQGTDVTVQQSGGPTIFWRAQLASGTASREIVLGETGDGVTTKVPLVAPTGTIDIRVSSPERTWSNDFVVDRVTDALNGGSRFDDRPVDRATLDADVSC